MAKKLKEVLASAIQSESIWNNRPISLRDGGFWGSFFGSMSSSGQNVNAEKSLTLSAVWACVRLISTSVAGLPLNVYTRKPDGSREIARELQVYDIVHTSPNEDMTAFSFWQAMVASMLLWGNGYAEIKRIGGEIKVINFLMPKAVRLDCDDHGRLQYFFTPKNGVEREIDRNNMLHIPAFSLDGRVGMSAIKYGTEIFGSAIAANQAANGTFKNGLMPTVAFTVDRILKPTQRDDFRSYVDTISGAMNAGKSPVLEQGIKPELIGINPADAQLLESRAFSKVEICSWFGVPPWMIGVTDKGSNWGTGLEQQMISFLTFCISSFTNQIQQCVNKRLFTPSQRVSHYSEFSLEGFLKADSAARSSFYSVMVQNGIYTRDDCRVRENLSRKGGNADVLTVQLAMAPLDSIGKGGLSAVEAIQKAYLGVGKVLTSDEARELVNQAGANLTIPGPDFSQGDEG